MILLDLNVVLDVFQERQPHYPTSARVVDLVVGQQVKGFVSAHAVTTIHYLVSRHFDEGRAVDAVDWLLSHFDTATVGRDELLRARSLNWRDFEDAVVAAAAASAGCHFIVTRNVKDFAGSPVMPILPEEYLALV